MKQFRFSLETVLDYKQQVLEALQGEHAAILAQVHRQEELVQAVEKAYQDYDEEYSQKKSQGLMITEALLYQNGLRAMEQQIQLEHDKLAAVKTQEEAKRAQVVEAKKDTSSLEKLREKKLESYNKAAAKSEEQLIEELVSLARTTAAAAVSV